jgi:hypothetical protein
MSAPVIDPTLELQPDETEGLDVDIRTSGLDFNYDGLPLNTGEESGNIYRHLIKFDLSSLDGGEVFSSVTLQLTITGDYATAGSTVAFYRQKRAWVETEATWNSYSTGNAWQSAGGFGANDCEQSDIGSLVMSDAQSGAIEIPLAPANKAALDLDNGWLVKSGEEVGTRYRYADLSDATASKRPKLTIEYTYPALRSELHVGVGL